MYFEPTTCASLSLGLLVAETADGVDVAAVEVALSTTGAAAVDEEVAAVVVPVATTGVVEVLSMLGRSGAVEVPVTVEVASVSAAARPILKTPIATTLIRRTLAAENAYVVVFINRTSTSYNKLLLNIQNNIRILEDYEFILRIAKAIFRRE